MKLTIVKKENAYYLVGTPCKFPPFMEKYEKELNERISNECCSIGGIIVDMNYERRLCYVEDRFYSFDQPFEYLIDHDIDPPTAEDIAEYWMEVE